MKFENMKIDSRAKTALRKKGFVNATEVQEKVIPVAMKKDVVVQSRTGSGKTLAFLIPIFEGVEGRRDVEAIILVPTRELAQQVEHEARAFAKEYGYSSVCIYGGASIEKQIENLPSTIVVGTPGRVMDLMRRGYLSLNNIKFFVLDEADRMMDMGFLDDIIWIMKRSNERKRIFLFSATMPPQIIGIAHRFMKDEEKFILSEDEITAKGVEQYWISVGEINKMAKLSALIDSEPGKYLIFCNTKRKTQEVAEKLQRFGYKSYPLHGDMRQASRTRTMNDFKNGKINILVSTDVAARGIDVHGITHVVNYDVPLYPKDYVHRIGRTGRMEKNGKSITFVRKDDIEYWERIERFVGKKIKRMKIEGKGRIKERIDYREYANAYGMVRFKFSAPRDFSEWELTKILENGGIKDYHIGSINMQGKEGYVEIHYASAHRVKGVRALKSVQMMR